MSELSDRIRAVAEKVGGLQQLAERIGVPRRTLGSWLQGRKPKPDALQKIAEVGEVSLSWLITGDGNQDETPISRSIRLAAERSGLGERSPDTEAAKAEEFEAAFSAAMGKLKTLDTDKTPASHEDDIILSLMEILARIVTSAHRDQQIKISPEKVTVETARLYNELRAKVPDLSDSDLVEATLPQLRLSLKRRLQDAASTPGTGKRSAS